MLKCLPMSRTVNLLYFRFLRCGRTDRLSCLAPLHTCLQSWHSCCYYQLRYASSDVATAPARGNQTERVTTVAVPREPERRLEQFIPVTLTSILQLLVKDNDVLSSEDQRSLGKLVASLDAKYSQRFYGILEETKLLYDSLDPDKDTFQTRELSKKELLDSEYSLLQKVGKLLEMANFSEILREDLVSMLHDRDTSGIIVSVNHSDYELLRVWTKGLQLKKISLLTYVRSRISTLFNLRRVKDTSTHLYTRVFLAVRSRGEKQLYLKIFKEVHIDKLEHLLPKGKIKMSNLDKRFLVSSVLLGACLPLLRVVPFHSDLKDQWVWGGAALAAFVAGRAWIGYKNKRNYYLANLATTLYYKTIANNRGVLSLLCDRAQDKEVKEVILAYTFLLNPLKAKGSDLRVYDTSGTLKLRVEEWLKEHFHLKNFSFDVDDALAKLDGLGLLIRRRNGTLEVANMKDSLATFSGAMEPLLSRRDSQSSDDQMWERTQVKKELPSWS